ncbi:phosphatidylserine decarboxylase family protein [Psychroflexus lacisalsi]|jgi:phosphatidylserine decarboxylase|uniref:Phosphatidylserine decarboxylase proenzyme n=1 Tax=Psychroflexus lacisalsi TaxID=503928 RepID=A0ABP3VF39_9FLAO|nr:phosphatidylserine decarboxylase family protein [Psychroflexus lacisalsi]MBZ9619495.1 phosphatidylserine decarboxylase family protein [Psychroflexus lacisalsi]
MFHKEGYKILVSSLIGLIIINLLSNLLIDESQQWLIILIFLVSFILFFLVAQFFRNPKREIEKNEGHILAPVDGKVVTIEKVFEPEFVNEERLQVSIFMSPINVHVTRYPIGGKIVYNKYHPGKFLVAWHPKSSEENERTTVVVETKNFGNILFRQIAGAVARRIVNYAKEGQTAVQGEDSGFIKFGSRVDIFLPVDAEVSVKINDVVKGGKTVIFKKA